MVTCFESRLLSSRLKRLTTHPSSFIQVTLMVKLLNCNTGVNQNCLILVPAPNTGEQTRKINKSLAVHCCTFIFRMIWRFKNILWPAGGRLVHVCLQIFLFAKNMQHLLMFSSLKVFSFKILKLIDLWHTTQGFSKSIPLVCDQTVQLGSNYQFLMFLLKWNK